MRLRTVIFAALALALTAAPAAAQLQDNLGSITAQNAKGYLGPLTKALSGTMNASVFQTGHVPRAGVSIQLGARLMGVMFADDDRGYSPTPPPGFTPIEDVVAPTVIGGGTAVRQQGAASTELWHPGGFDVDQFAIAVPQVSIGGVAGTRLIARWISLDVGDSDFGKFSLFGIGGQHSISQYFPGMPVDLAAGAFYQTFTIDDDLLETTALQFNVTASKSFGLIQPYAGVGYDIFNMDASYESATDPNVKIAVDFDQETNAHLTLGVMAGFPVVKLYAEGNIAATNGVAVGLSFGN